MLKALRVYRTATCRAGGSQRTQSPDLPSNLSHVAVAESSRANAGGLIGAIDGSPVAESVETETINPPD